MNLFLHLRSRLRVLYSAIMATTAVSFTLLTLAAPNIGLNPSTAQIVLLGFLIAGLFGYVSLQAYPAAEETIALSLLFLLNIATTFLVAATGVFLSPFLLLYIVWISLTAQIHAKKLALSHVVLSILGSFGAFALAGLGVFSVPNLGAADLPLTFTLLYPIMMLFSAVVLFPRVFHVLPKQSLIHDIHEKIVRSAPIGILFLDHMGRILSGNETARSRLSWQDGQPFHDITKHTLDELKSLLEELASSKETRILHWHHDEGKTPLRLSAHVRPGERAEDTEYVIFLH